jgi:translation initiation factor IF-1
MPKSELILLDATVTEVINNRAFRAILSNGHDIVAFLPGEITASQQSVRAGVMVKVRMSPFDMSRGEMILEQVES